MNREQLIECITRLLQKAGYREVRLVYIFLRAMLDGKGAEA